MKGFDHILANKNTISGQFNRDAIIAGKIVENFGSDFFTLQGVLNRFELFASVNNNAVIDDLAFDLIFKDEINHFKPIVATTGETV
jgi:hypothetical protein